MKHYWIIPLFYFSMFVVPLVHMHWDRLLEPAEASPIEGFRLENWGKLTAKYLKSRSRDENYSEETLGNTFTQFVISMEGQHPRTVQENGAAMIGEVIRQTELYNLRWQEAD